MPDQNRFSLLRTILKALGLPQEAIDDILERIQDWLGDKEKPDAPLEYPYRSRDHFFSPAEQSFYLVLKGVVGDKALVFGKTNLGDLFYVRTSDESKFRTYTNKIDRKHVDFVLCDAKTLKPLVGIELDDASHGRADRQTRDEFVQNVFAAAKLPLVRFPVRTSYSSTDLLAQLRPYLPGENVVLSPAPVVNVSAQSVLPLSAPTNSVAVPATPAPIPAPAVEPDPPRCPQCNSPMVLRTAKQGANQGNRFWGCTNYPRCRGIVKYTGG